jgi:hypothetical protein
LAPIKARLGAQLEAWMAQQGDKGMETELKAKSRQGPGEEQQPQDQPTTRAKNKAKTKAKNKARKKSS